MEKDISWHGKALDDIARAGKMLAAHPERFFPREEEYVPAKPVKVQVIVGPKEAPVIRCGWESFIL